MEPFWGMWLAIIILTPLAIFLAYKATTDSSLFDIDQYRIKLNKAWEWTKNKLGIGIKRKLNA